MQRSTVLAAGGLGALSLLWIGLHIGGGTATRYFDDIVTALSAALATAACWWAAGRHGPERRFWMLMGTACAAWTVAELIWAIYDLVLGESVPPTSWADVGYLGAIPLAVAAFLCHPSLHQGGRKGSTRAVLDGVVVATAALVFSWTAVLGPLWRHSNMTTLSGIVTVAYPFGDVVLVVLVALILRSLRSVSRPDLYFVLGGLLVMAASDSGYAFLVEKGRYATGSLIDVGWIVAYLSIAVGASAARTQVVVPESTTGATSLSIAAPYVVMLAALSAIALEVQLGRSITSVDWWMATALVVLVLLRQGAALWAATRRVIGGARVDGHGLHFAGTSRLWRSAPNTTRARRHE
ncbi:MAG: hypothetical protein ABSG81_05705 [Acidimicrobiales bacterium]